MEQTIKDKSQIEILLIIFYNHLNDYKNESSSDEVDINMVLENFEELHTEILQAYEKEINAKDKLASEEAMFRINEYQKLKKELDEKDKEYVILLADRDKLEMYRHNQLKKSDFHIWCKNCKKKLNTRLYKHCGYNPDVTISIISHSKYESLEE